MRTFIAINLSDEVKNSINAIIENFKKIDPKIKWVKKENLHLTLKFLGEVDEEKIKRIGSSLEKKVKFSDFEITLNGIGTFPRTIWIGTTDGKEKVKEIWENVEEAAEECGFERDHRSFSAHVTIGRIKSKPEKTLKKEIENLKEFNFGTQMVSSITMIKSTLTKAGPIYEEIYKIKLAQ